MPALHLNASSARAAGTLMTGILALLAFAWPTTPVQAAPAAGIKPDLLYHNYCSVCHGDKGDGNSRASRSFKRPPRDFTTAGDSMTRDYMLTVVADGKPGTAMMGWKTQLSAAEIAAVVDWIRATFMAGKPFAPADPHQAGISGTRAHGGRAQDAGEPARLALPSQPAHAPMPAADMTLPFANGLKGNTNAGRVFYNANCATCHGEKGDGKGPRAYFINPKPRNFLEPSVRSGFNRPILFAAIYMGRPGTEMPAWSKVISDQEIANVAEYVFQQFIRKPAGK
jgi:mono/diheme cytochrome c family protein